MASIKFLSLRIFSLLKVESIVATKLTENNLLTLSNQTKEEMTTTEVSVGNMTTSDDMYGQSNENKTIESSTEASLETEPVPELDGTPEKLENNSTIEMTSKSEHGTEIDTGKTETLMESTTESGNDTVVTESDSMFDTNNSSDSKLEAIANMSDNITSTLGSLEDDEPILAEKGMLEVVTNLSVDNSTSAMAEAMNVTEVAKTTNSTINTSNSTTFTNMPTNSTMMQNGTATNQTSVVTNATNIGNSTASKWKRNGGTLNSNSHQPLIFFSILAIILTNFMP